MGWFYGNVKEEITNDITEPRGGKLYLRMHVDIYHSGYKVTRRSRTGFLIFVNTSLIQWMSKKQPMIQTSVFGAEFLAMKHGMETIRGIRYKFRIVRIPIEGPPYIYRDKISVIHYTQQPGSSLMEKSNSIYHHATIEIFAMGEGLLTTNIPTGENHADLLKKVLYGRK